MENMENLVTEEVAENVEQTTEQTPPATKTYSQEEVDAIVGKRLARQETKIRREYDRKYGALEEVAKVGTGKDTVEDATASMRQFYTAKGVKMPQAPEYSAKDVEILANAEAAEIIRGGFEDVVEETDRLSAIGTANMTAKEKAVFKALAQHRQTEERNRELTKLGVTADTINSKEFQEFAGKFTPSTPITEIYQIFAKTQPKKEYQTMGSMKQGQSNGVKDYYTPEEIERLTEEDLDDPKVWEAVRRSMTGR